MIGYAMLGTNDLAGAEAFWGQIVGLLGGAEATAYRSEARVWYAGPSGGPPLLVITKPHDGKTASVGNGSMLALVSDSRAVVDAAHAKALSLGGADEGAPGTRTSPFYGAYFRDLDGNKVCVFTLAGE